MRRLFHVILLPPAHHLLTSLTNDLQLAHSRMFAARTHSLCFRGFRCPWRPHLPPYVKVESPHSVNPLLKSCFTYEMFWRGHPRLVLTEGIKVRRNAESWHVCSSCIWAFLLAGRGWTRQSAEMPTRPNSKSLLSETKSKQGTKSYF